MDWRRSGREAQEAIANDPQNRRYRDLLTHGSMRFGLYGLRDHDPQTPHTQDEVYLVATGSALFERGDERCSVEPGDLLFVPAGLPHRFVEPSDDFQTWVVFWGPEGGEDETP